MKDPNTTGALVRLLTSPEAGYRAVAVRVLAERRDRDATPQIAKLANDRDSTVRREASKALERLAGGQSVDELVRLFLTAPSDEERSRLERALIAACSRVDYASQRAGPLLAAMENADPPSRAALLPVLGTLGGDAARVEIGKALRDADPRVRDAGTRALCNWPDATEIDRMLGVARRPVKPEHRRWAVQGIARVAPRPGQLPSASAFEVLREAFELADVGGDKRLVLARMSAVRTVQCLAFATARLDDATVGAVAVESAAKLAEGILGSHPREARAAFEKVLAVSKDPSLLARVERLLGRMKP